MSDKRKILVVDDEDALRTVLSSELLGMQFGKQVDELELAGLWLANNDARSYAILGDPAARLKL